jgi:hypothetical protein
MAWCGDHQPSWEGREGETVSFRHGAKGGSRFGMQPIRQRMEEERWNCKLLADRAGVPYHHLYLAIIGRTPPSPHLREALPPILGIRLSALFTPESLASDFQSQYHPSSTARVP